MATTLLEHASYFMSDLDEGYLSEAEAEVDEDLPLDDEPIDDLPPEDDADLVDDEPNDDLPPEDVGESNPVYDEVIEAFVTSDLHSALAGAKKIKKDFAKFMSYANTKTQEELPAETLQQIIDAVAKL